MNKKVFKVAEKIMCITCVLYVATHFTDFQQWIADIAYSLPF